MGLIPQSEFTANEVPEGLIRKDVEKKKLVSYIWDSLDKSPEERRFIFKLDSFLLTFACLGK